tara:strand:+ start:667 stop:2388 length:1722 start_codon:yes stop_codon:yes gene_type:complete
MSNDPVLKKIFNRFYPKSQTTDMGKKLYVLAWVIEILVVLAGLFTALIMYYSTGDNTAAGMSIALTFFIAAIAELTKIPLATAFYYAVRIRWKSFFLIGLVLINILTFETIINGMQRNFSSQTSEIKTLQYELSSLVSVRINSARNLVSEKNKVQDEISIIEKNRQEIIKKITQLNNQRNDEIKIFYSTKGGNQLKELQEQRDNKRGKIDKLEKEITDLNLQSADCTSSIIAQGGCDNIKDAINSKNSSIIKLAADVSNVETKIQNITAEIDKFSADNIKNINDRYDARLKQYENERLDFDNQFRVQNEKKSSLDGDSLERIKNKKDLELKERTLIKEINQKAIENNFYSFAMLLKTSEDKDKKKESNSSQNIDNSDLSDDDRKLLTWGEQKYHTLTEKDLQWAFWLIFGVMALVISFAGTAVALGSLHLQDPRMHEERQRTKIGNIEKLFRSIRYSFMALRKRLLSPKIVYQEKEVEVEKEVIKEIPIDKIVEKEVIKEIPVDKIVYRDVPKEVVRRELVHVPLYTNDKDLLDNSGNGDGGSNKSALDDLDMTSDELREVLKEIRKKNNKEE